jgi:pyruvate kinase
LTLSFGVHAVHTEDIASFSEMVDKATAIALSDGLAKDGQSIVVTAGVPFGRSGTTNVLRIAVIKE